MLKTIIRHLRKVNNLTQEEVADYLHVQRTTYSRYQNGSNSISLEILCKLADLYNVSTDFLLQRKENTDNSSNIDLIQLFSNADSTHREIAVTVLKMGQSVQIKRTIESDSLFLPVMNTDLTSIPSQDDVVSVNATIKKDGGIIPGDFAIISTDDSMKIAGISKDDYVVIRPQKFINPGEIALIHIGNRLVLRTVFEQEGFIKLIPSNENFVIEYFNNNDIIIVGRVVKIIKKKPDASQN
jgi:transcriptional regulator with XRE-family HTH domain